MNYNKIIDTFRLYSMEHGTLRLYIMLQLVALFPSHETGESKLQ